MSVFDIDYTAYVWKYLVPPAKRLSKWLAWGSAVMAAKQWWNDSIFSTWALGDSVDSPYNPHSSYTYSAGDRIIYPIQSDTATFTGSYAYYGDNAVYEALYSGFNAQPPTGTNVVPETPPSWVVDSNTALLWLNTGNNGNPYYWVKVCSNFIGANERASYSCQHIIYEYALNRWFRTTFRQPVTGTSDIYIIKNTINTDIFYFYPERYDSFFAPVDISPPSAGPCTTFFFPSSSSDVQNDFTIYFPIAVYNALDDESHVTAGSNTAKRDSIVRSFADLICPAGAFYNIITY